MMYSTINVTVYHTNQGISDSLESLESLLLDSTSKTFTLPSESTFDKVFHLCAKSCGIIPLYLPLFALRDTSSKSWINPNAKLHDGEEECSEDDHVQNRRIDVEFRVRFTFKNKSNDGGILCYVHRYSSHDDSLKSVMNNKVIRYLFHQRRSDFLKGETPIVQADNDKMGAALGVAVFDLLRLASETKCTIKTVLNKLSKYSELLPVCCLEILRSMDILSRFRVFLRFKNYLRQYKADHNEMLSAEPNPAYFYNRYLQNLEKVVGANHTETYDLMQMTTTEDVKKITIGADCGIVEGDNIDNEQWCDFHDITDMKMHDCKKDSKNFWVISISQLNGKVLNLSLSNKVDAENLASGIDGYYQLLTDPHHYLCKDVTSPALVERLSCLCHGPISRAYADSCIRQQPHIHVGDCLLRQSEELADEYFVSVVVRTSPTIVIKAYLLNQEKTDTGHRRLRMQGSCEPHWHESLRSLLDTYRDDQHNNIPVPFHVESLIHPNSKHQSILKVYRCGDSHHTDEERLQNYSNQQTPSTAIILQKDFTFVRFLGVGKFSEVRLYVSKASTKRRVVFKKVHEPQESYDLGRKQHVEESFQDCMCMLNFLKNDHIVHLIGTMRNMMVLEYVPYGSVTAYLQNINLSSSNPTPNSLEWFLSVLWQLTHACTYLEDKSCAHGNIRGKNVLLWQDFPQPHIKLADPGVRTWSRTIVHNSIKKNVSVPILLAPWLAREFYVFDSEIPASNYPTVEGDKWSYATTVCEICNSGFLAAQPQSAFELSSDMLQRYAGGDVVELPDALSGSKTFVSLVRQCWNPRPQKRPEFKKLLRELGAVLASDQNFALVEPNIVVNENYPCSIPELQTYKDCDLIFIQKLGSGNFGHVDWYTCVRDPGRPEHVAVKSLHRTRADLQSTCEFHKEIETMRKLNHKYVVQLKGVAEPSLRIVMEYLPCGSLLNYMEDQRKNNVQLRSLYSMLYEFSSQIAQGMLALQEKRLVHRDLALRNILLARSINSSLSVKIADFGLSRTLEEDRTYYKGKTTEFPFRWYAPECLKVDCPSSFHFSSDVWSFGVTIWEMFSYAEKPIYEDKCDLTFTSFSDMLLYCKELQKFLKDGIRLPLPPECPGRVYNIILKCWDYNPSGRPKFEELRQSFDKLSTSRYL